MLPTGPHRASGQDASWLPVIGSDGHKDRDEAEQQGWGSARYAAGSTGQGSRAPQHPLQPPGMRCSASPAGGKMLLSGCAEWKATATAMRIARKTPAQQVRGMVWFKTTRAHGAHATHTHGALKSQRGSDTNGCLYNKYCLHGICHYVYVPGFVFCQKVALPASRHVCTPLHPPLSHDFDEPL